MENRRWRNTDCQNEGTDRLSEEYRLSEEKRLSEENRLSEEYMLSEENRLVSCEDYGIIDDE